MALRTRLALRVSGGRNACTPLLTASMPVRAVQPAANDQVVVKLKSIEYQLTSAIDRVVREFATLDMKLAERTDPVRVELFVSEPERAPEGEVREYIAKKRKGLTEVADELAKKYAKGFTVRVADPEAEPGLAE